MNVKFLLAIMSVFLNIAFILDVLLYAYTSKGLGAFIFRDEGLQSLSGFITTHYDGMSPVEFLVANGILLSFSVVLVIVSVWIGFYQSGIVRVGGVKR